MSAPNSWMKSHPNSHFLPPIKTQITKSRRPRPPTVEESGGESRIPLRAPSPPKERRSGLRRIFRSKSDKDNGENLLASPAMQSPLSPFSFQISSKSPLNSPALSESFQSRTYPPLVVETPMKDKTSSSKPKKEKKNTPAPTKASKPSNFISHNACDQLPLFRAYPQSIKHDKLTCPNITADTIIRNSKHKRNASLREDISQGIPTEEETKIKGTEKAKSKHKRHLSGSISKAEWSEKVYVLITSGYLMQYPGEGSFDRLPEKILQLSKDSVVFASDAIPGKHWVLQVSQAIGSDGQTPVADPRSLLSRLSFRSTEYRKIATSFLLTLESAKEMDAWISVIRREIEGLGGKKHVSETGKPLDLQRPKSPSFENSPNRFSSFVFPKIESVDSWNNSVPNRQFKNELANPTALAPRPLSTIRPSIDAPSVATSATSKDDAYLESLRGSSNHRFSHLSSGPPTIGTSPDTSPLPSPTQDTSPSSDGFVADQLSDHRGSIQFLEDHVIGQLAANPRPRPHSTIVFSGQKLQDFSAVSNSRSSINQKPTFNVGNFENSRTFGNSTRKKTPPTLSLEGPLTPIEDSHSPSAFDDYTPGADIFQMPQQDEFSRPQSSSAAINTLSRSTFPKRYSSLTPLVGLEKKTPPARHAPLPPPNLPLPPRPLGRLSELNTSSYVLYPTQQKGRRPTSMQVKTSITPRPPVSLHTHPGSPIQSETVMPRSPPMRVFAPTSPTFSQRPVSRPKSAQMSPRLQNRRSMPQFIINGPPSLPPPECALPPLPPGVGV